MPVIDAIHLMEIYKISPFFKCVINFMGHFKLVNIVFITVYYIVTMQGYTRPESLFVLCSICKIPLSSQGLAQYKSVSKYVKRTFGLANPLFLTPS